MVSRRPEVTNERRRLDEFEASARPDEPQVLPPGSRLSFGPFLLDPETGRLSEQGRLIALAPKPFETLHYLARHPSRVVSRQELMERLWPGTFVTDDVLVQCIVDIRKALGDSAKASQYVETLPRRGYQFIASVQVPDQLRPATLPSGKPIPSTLEGLPPAVEVPTTAPRPGSGARLIVPALLILGTIGLGVRFWRSGATPVTAVAAEPGSVMVLPISIQDPTDESHWLRQGLAELLRSELGQKPGVHVVARHRLTEALDEQGLSSESGALSDPAAVSIARRLGAERIVSGSLVRLGDQFALSAQLLHVPSGRADGDLLVRGRYPADLMDSVDELARRVLERWDGSAPEASNAFRPVRLSTRSVDAWRHYAEALAWFARGGRKGAEEAEKRLDEATRLDPRFAWAYLKKAEIQGWRRRLGYGGADPAPALREAARLAQQLPERERLVVEAAEAAVLKSDLSVAEKRLRDLLRLYPSFAEELGVPRALAEVLYLQQRWNDLITLGEEHVESPSLPSPERALLSSQLAKAYRQKGEAARALVHARRAVRLWPEKDGPAWLRQRTDLGRLALDAGRRDEALPEFRAVASSPEADVTNLTDAAWGLYMSSEKVEAERVLARALQADAGYGNAHHLKGWLQLSRGEARAAAESLERAFQLTSPGFGMPHLGFVSGDAAALDYAGVAWKMAGEKQRSGDAFQRVIGLCRAQRDSKDASPAARWEAESLLAIVSARIGLAVRDPGPFAGDEATSLLQAARLAAVQGRREAALNALGHSLALVPGERQHVKDDPNFAALRADPEFQRLVAGTR